MPVFHFKGIPCTWYGAKVISLSPPKRAGSETEILTVPGRAEPLIKEKKEYENTEIEAELFIEDPSKARGIFEWLKGSGKFIYDDESDKYYNVVSNSVIDVVRVSDMLRSLTVKFICSPFAYSVENTPISHIFTDITDSSPEKAVTVKAGGSYTCEPLYFFRWAGRIEMTVNGGEPLIIDSGTSDGEYTETYTPSGNGTPIYHYISPEATMFVSTPLRLAYKTENGERKVCCEMTSGRFPMLENGNNTIKFKLLSENTWEHTMSDGSVRLYKRTEQKLLVFDVTPNARWL